MLIPADKILELHAMLLMPDMTNGYNPSGSFP